MHRYTPPFIHIQRLRLLHSQTSGDTQLFTLHTLTQLTDTKTLMSLTQYARIREELKARFKTIKQKTSINYGLPRELSGNKLGYKLNVINTKSF